ncbi:class I SAM-dependent methyltransferase [Nitrospirillum sp. BR 11163]|uniref:class I SAM-dependent methyltransferase n=1 Tax=Nitrospirillum sp. BR 11163 TaxID=3104323 RepID=UPI002AFEB8B7|nr:class I SAM-dependent methyltransferase [Nitrospirillum sp. BR 11163]MEA1672616.1 class I SAM-dependent methyltransferase [Nitrospirillum sp. BR 11163]
MLQRPSYGRSLISMLSDLSGPDTRAEGLATLETSGYLTPALREAWAAELARPKYAIRYLSGIVSQEKVRVEKLLRQVGGELTAVKTHAVIANFSQALKVCGQDHRLDPDRIRRSRILDFGAGVWSSLSASLILYAIGFEQADAFEPFPIGPDMVAESVFQTIRWLYDTPGMFALFGATPQEMKRRVAALDFSGLEERLAELNAGGPRGVDFGPVRLFNNIDMMDNGYYDLVCSNSVLEHVEDMRGALARQREILKDDGACVHTVDFTDHRAISADREDIEHSFHMYYDGILDEVNGLRAGDLESLFVLSGFHGSVVRLMAAPEGYIDHTRLHPRFAHYSPADLAAAVNSYVLTKA